MIYFPNYPCSLKKKMRIFVKNLKKKNTHFFIYIIFYFYFYYY